MDRLDFFFRQLVTEGDLDLGFDQVQERIESSVSDDETDITGVASGGNVVESGTPDLNVTVEGPCRAFDPDGKQVRFTDDQTVNASLDSLGVATEVTTPGNSRYISLFLEFAEDPQQPETDGNGQPVFFRRNASFAFSVVQSAEDVSPVLPSLRDDALLLADITRAYGQGTITTGDIDFTRRQDFFRNEGNFLVDIIRGRIKDVLHDIVDALNQYAQDVDTQTTGVGADLVGIEGFTSTPTGGGSALGYGNDTVRNAINDIVNDLTSNAGGTKVGAGPKTGSVVSLPSPLSLSESNIDTHNETLLDYMETIRNTPFLAENVTYTPHGDITATNVQDAIDDDIDNRLTLSASLELLIISNWFTRSAAGSFTGTFNGAAYGSDTWVIVGTSGEIQTSPNGEVWTQQTAAGAFAGTFQAVAHDGSGLFCAVGSSAEIQTSPDGVTWTQRTAAGAFAGTFTAITHDGSGLFVAVGSAGEIQTSPDGTTWTQRTPDTTTNAFLGVAHNGSDLWCLVGQNEEIQTSPDGITWTSVTNPTSFTGNFQDIAYDRSWIAIGSSGHMQSAPDAVAWTTRKPPTLAALSDLSSNGAVWILVGGPSGGVATILNSLRAE